ncbi:Gfo/Idh/MocA family protein [Streptomyces syringium]|uniref:Gfo/Idh/MocA family protein n=1 Tax=Streptomyces syringium TaxID=76729 RepID=UPI003417BED0
MKIALLGTNFGQAHAAVYAARDDVEVVMFGRDADKTAQAAGQFGFAAGTDLDAAFTDPSFDLVDVCLPIALHAPMVLRALEAGKHVLTELPMAGSLEEGRRIMAAAESSDRHVFVDMFERFIPANQALSDALGEGTYGRLQELTWARGPRRDPPDHRALHEPRLHPGHARRRQPSRGRRRPLAALAPQRRLRRVPPEEDRLAGEPDAGTRVGGLSEAPRPCQQSWSSAETASQCSALSIPGAGAWPIVKTELPVTTVMSDNTKDFSSARITSVRSSVPQRRLQCGGHEARSATAGRRSLVLRV